MFTCLTNRVQHPLVKKLAGHYWHPILFTDENRVQVFVVRNVWPSSTHWICSSSFFYHLLLHHDTSPHVLKVKIGNIWVTVFTFTFAFVNILIYLFIL